MPIDVKGAILVTGPTGMIGRLLVDTLVEQDTPITQPRCATQLRHVDQDFDEVA